MDDTSGKQGSESALLPYQAWVEAAMRGVVLRALEEAAKYGLPGEHHFYITFRTDHPGSVVPARLREKYPEDMTIVMQHQYRDLIVDGAAGYMAIGLSFGGIPSALTIPLAAITGFADPSVQFGLQFVYVAPVVPEVAAPVVAPAVPESSDTTPMPDATPQVVSLDAFRRKRD